LHASLGQYLAAVGMSLTKLERANCSETSETLDECRQLLDRCVDETRTLSHLLHPPLLDEIGFASAATSYVEEFARRSGIKSDISLDLPHRLSEDRVLQESLTNIHRHSGSERAEIRADVHEETVSLEVKDYGRGISKERLHHFKISGNGVGVRPSDCAKWAERSIFLQVPMAPSCESVCRSPTFVKHTEILRQAADKVTSADNSFHRNRVDCLERI
jgi:signal transduction histidine kinase